MKLLYPLGLAPVLACLTAILPAAAEEEIADQLMIELNAAADQAEGCKLSFLALNGHDADITDAVFETVLFDGQGQVDRLILMDFGTLPAGRPRVRQFVIAGMACTDLSQVLFNGAEECAAEALAEGACTTDLRLETRTDIGVTG